MRCCTSISTATGRRRSAAIRRLIPRRAIRWCSISWRSIRRRPSTSVARAITGSRARRARRRCGRRAATRSPSWPAWRRRSGVSSPLAAWSASSGSATAAVESWRCFWRRVFPRRWASSRSRPTWTSTRGPTPTRTPPLTGSLNPARQPPLAPSVSQRHYAGGRDQVVPVQVTRQGAAPGAEVIVVADYDHRCCWATLWPSVLAALERDLGALREYRATLWPRPPRRRPATRPVVADRACS